MSDPAQPKIIIDSDWKAQAQKEKERLVAKEREAAKAPATASPTSAGFGASPAGVAPAGGGGEGREGEYDMPPADFPSLVGTMVTQALLYLGAFPDPQTGRAVVSLEHAKFNIDLLAVLEEKTKGNLTAVESSDLAQALNELRLRFVEISKALVQMQAKAALEAQRGGAGAAGPDFVPKLNLRQP